MVLVGMEVITIDIRYRVGKSDWFSILVGYSLQYTDFRSLSDARSVIVSAVIPVYALGKKKRVKTVSFLTVILTHWVFVAAELAERMQ